MKAFLFESDPHYEIILNLVHACKKATILELQTDCFQESLTLLRKWLLTNLTILKITIVLRNFPENRLDDIFCPVQLLKKMIFCPLSL